MKEFAIELNSAGVVELERLSARERVAAFVELTKPRITFLIVLTSAAGFALGSRGRIDYAALSSAMLGIALLSSGIATLNQYMERDLDALMRRTANRPLPSGKLLPWEALVFGVGLTVMAEVYLAVLVNPLSALLGLTVISGYLFGYTPLKTKTSLSTLVGAFPGAVPPLVGWAAARGNIGIEAWVLFAILFLWQFPHFLAIAWMYREDYARAGFQMMSSDDETGARSSSQSVLFCMLLLIVAGVPGYLGLTNAIYVPIAFALGGLFIAMAMRFHGKRTPQQARALFVTSIVYLPLLLIALVATKL